MIVAGSMASFHQQAVCSIAASLFAPSDEQPCGREATLLGRRVHQPWRQLIARESCGLGADTAAFVAYKLPSGR
jgi:hypothetical protein